MSEEGHVVPIFHRSIRIQSVNLEFYTFTPQVVDCLLGLLKIKMQMKKCTDSSKAKTICNVGLC